MFAFGMDNKSVAENLVKINVYYTSLNEKIIQDEIVYSIQVRREQSNIARIANAVQCHS